MTARYSSTRPSKTKPNLYNTHSDDDDVRPSSSCPWTMRHGQGLLLPSSPSLAKRTPVHPDAVDMRAVSRATIDDVTRSVGMMKNERVFLTAGGFHETHVRRRRAADEDAGLG